MSKPMHDLIEIIHFTENVAAKIHGLLDEAEIYRVVNEEFAKSKRYNMSLVLLTADESKLRIVGVSKPAEMLKAAEKATGLRMKGYEIDLDKSSIYSRVVREGKTVEAKVSDIMGELFPRPLATMISKILGYEKLKSILTPIYRQGKIIGALAMGSTELAEHFIPSVEILARHISNALEMADEYAKRMRMEEALRQSHEKFERLFMDNPEAIVYLDPENQILEANPRFEEVFGYSLDEIKGKRINNVLVPKEKLKEAEMLDKKSMQGHLYLETIRKRKDGSLVPVSISASPSPSTINGWATVAIYTDITKRVEAEKSLNEAREYAESIVETVRESLVVLDADLRVVSANRSFYKTFKVTKEETEDHFLYELGNHQWDIPELRGLLEEIFAKNTTIEDYEVEHDFPHIGTRVMLLNARRIRREENKPQSILLAIEDITEQRKAEQRLRELTYRLNSLTPGGCLLSEEHERCFKAYADLTHHGVPGLCILREDPDKLVKTYGLNAEEIRLLSSRPLKGYPALTNLQEVSIAISQFLQAHPAGVTLLDGLEYLTSRFGFEPVYKFIQEKRFDFLENGAILLIPLNMETLNERERALLTSEIKTLQ